MQRFLVLRSILPSLTLVYFVCYWPKKNVAFKQDCVKVYRIIPNIKVVFTFVPCSILILLKLYLFTNWCTTYLLTYLLTPWCRVLLEKLTDLQLVKKFLAFHGTRRFITALTSVRYLSLSWASPIQSIYPHPISCRSILILSTHLRLGLPSSLLPSGFPTKTLYTLYTLYTYAPHAQPISFFSILSPAQYWVRSTDHFAPRHSDLKCIRCALLVWHGRCPGDTPIPAKPSQACLVWSSRLRCWALSQFW